MSSPKRSVLITGCSDGGMGAALAIAFHEAGFHVYATARNPAKMTQVAALGIETLPLDVQSESSIAACVAKVPALDILVNNAGAGYNMPVSDLSIPDAKKLFDLNVWSCIAVIQAFLPLVRKSEGMIVNHTSVASVMTIPFQSAYTASKAAMAMFSDSMRLELQPFGITVVELKTGGVDTNFKANLKDMSQTQTSLPKGSIYEPAKEAVEKVLTGEVFGDGPFTEPSQWAKQVVQDLCQKKPPPVIWRGSSAWMVRMGTMLPMGTLDGSIKKMTGFDEIERKVRK